MCTPNLELRSLHSIVVADVQLHWSVVAAMGLLHICPPGREGGDCMVRSLVKQQLQLAKPI